MKTVFQNVTYLSADGFRWERGDVCVSDGRISALASAGSVREADRVIDGAGKLLIPGLINSHSHSYTALLKESIEAVPLDIYMLHAIAGGSSRTEREIYVCTLLSAVALLKQGVTSAVDHFSQRPRQELSGIRAAVEAYEKAGMRANIALMYADMDFMETLPFLPGERPVAPKASADIAGAKEYLKTAEEAYRLFQGDRDRIGIMLGTDGPQRCSRALLEGTAELERAYKMGWQTHVLEARTQAITAFRRFGKPLVVYMAELGLLNDRTQMAHFVWADEREQALVKDHGVRIVHCPGSNLHLGSGICPADKLLRMGVSVALGSDGGNCGQTGMFEQLRLMARLQRVREPDYHRWLTAEQVLDAMYTGGRAVMMRDTLGRIAPGADADLVLLDTGDSLWQPAGDLTRQLVYYEGGEHIRLVMAAGEILVEDGKVLCVDEQALVEEAKEIVEKYKKDAAARDSFVQERLALVDQMYQREIRRDLSELG